MALEHPDRARKPADSGRRAGRIPSAAPWLTGLVSAAAALFALGWWLGVLPGVNLARRIPIPGNQPADAAETAQQVNIEGAFERFDATPASIPGEWPRFRGPASNNISPDTLALSAQPKVLWSLDLGDGHGGPAVLNGRVYLLDHDESRHADALRCFSLADGRECWRRSYKVSIKRNHGISRTVPAVAGRFVVSIGPLGHVLCADASDGRFVWGMDLAREFHSHVPHWYTAQCPLIDDGRVIIAPAGSALMIAVDCATGNVIWKTPNPGEWQMSHASVIPTTLAGRRMYVYSAVGGVAGVAADGPDAGRLLWSTTEWNHPVVAPSPVALDGDRLLLTAGYGAGSILLRISGGPDGYSAKTLALIPKENFACEQQTPICFAGHLFGILPKDGGELRGQLVCYHPDKGVVWSSGKTERFGLGPFIIAGDKIVVLNDDGTLFAARASTERYDPLLHAKILDGRDAWAPIAVAGGRMLLRDSHRLVCIDGTGGT